MLTLGAPCFQDVKGFRHPIADARPGNGTLPSRRKGSLQFPPFSLFVLFLCKMTCATRPACILVLLCVAECKQDPALSKIYQLFFWNRPWCPGLVFVEYARVLRSKIQHTWPPAWMEDMLGISRNCTLQPGACIWCLCMFGAKLWSLKIGPKGPIGV